VDIVGGPTSRPDGSFACCRRYHEAPSGCVVGCSIAGCGEDGFAVCAAAGGANPRPASSSEAEILIRDFMSISLRRARDCRGAEDRRR
jgi:hypothetical protein